MKLKIASVKEKPFTDRDGNEQEYFWYQAEKLSDETVIQFGSKNGGHEIGSTVDLFIEAKPDVDQQGKSRIIYKEITLKS